MPGVLVVRRPFTDEEVKAMCAQIEEVGLDTCLERAFGPQFAESQPRPIEVLGWEAVPREVRDLLVGQRPAQEPFGVH